MGLQTDDFEQPPRISRAMGVRIAAEICGQHAAIPLSSYGLYINNEGDVRSVCAPKAPCLDVNMLLVGPFEQLALQCGFLEKFLRLLNQTPLLRLIPGGFACQDSHKPACIIETNCVGN